MNILALFLTVILTYIVYVVLRSFAVDDGGMLEHAATVGVSAMLTVAWLKFIGGR